MKKIIVSAIIILLSTTVLMAQGDETIEGNLTIEGGTAGTSKKIIFKTSDNPDLSKYIGTDNYWTIFGANGNEGWKFKDNTGDILMQINGLGNNDGFVGIGTTNPKEKFHLEGNLLLDSYSLGNDNGIFFREGFSDTNKYNLSILNYDHSNSGITPDGLSINAYDGISFSTGSSTRNERMRIDRNGNVGIGSTNPTAELEVKSVANNDSEIHINASTDGEQSIIRFQDAGVRTWGFLSNYPNTGKFSLYNYQNSENAIVVDQAGNVGIGRTYPGEKLQVDGNISAFDGNIIINNSAVNQEDSGSIIWNEYTNNTNKGGAFIKYNGDGNYLQFLTNNETTEYEHLRMIRGGDVLLQPGSGNVGIGTTTTTPGAKLHIFNGNNSYGAILANSSETPFSLYTKSLDRVPNTETFRIGLKHNTEENNGFISFYRGGSTSGGFLGFSTNGTERIRINSNGNVGIGDGVIETKGYELAVKGRIITQEVKVALYGNWSDFVFKSDYNLPTLQEVETHIKEKGHLKDIPNATEVAKEGFFLGEMDAKLLQKIEELTLYTIQQQKEIESLKNENENMKVLNKKLLELQLRLEKLESRK